MTLPLQEFPLAMLIGIGATAVMDAWLLLLKHLGVPTLNFAFIGRWVGHLFRGQFAHAAIAKAVPIRGELAWGWLTHYAVGVGKLSTVPKFPAVKVKSKPRGSFTLLEYRALVQWARALRGAAPGPDRRRK